MAVLVDTNPDVNAVPADAGASQGTSVNNYTLSSYAQDIPPIISLVIVAESVAEWIEVVTNDVTVAETVGLAQLSKLANKDSENLNAILNADNQAIQNVDTSSNNNNASSEISQDQAQYSTDQAVWGVPLSNDQGAISLMNNAINATNSGTQTIVNMLSALVGYMWQVQPV